MTDKAQRDELYRKLRASDDPLERQVVKFSGVQQIMETDPKTGTDVPKMVTMPNYAGRTGLKPRNYRFKTVYESTWSVAYPCA
jgi:hypothetical protein